MGYDAPAIETESLLSEQAVTVLIASLTRLEDVDLAQDLQRGLSMPIAVKLTEDGDAAIGMSKSAELCTAFVDVVEQRMLELASDRQGLAWLRNYHDRTRQLRQAALRDPDAIAQVTKDVFTLLDALEGGDMPMAAATLRRQYSSKAERLARTLPR